MLRAAAVYAVVAWVLVQVASIIVPALRLPEWTTTLVVVAALLGFPLTLALSWFLRWTPRGLARDEAGDPRYRRAGLMLLAIALVGSTGLAAWHITRGIDESREQRIGRRASAASIAVLPCENLAGAEREYLAIGLAEELAHRLSRVDAFRVALGARSLEASMRAGLDPLTLGERLGVAALLSCSLRLASNGTKASVRLIEARDSTQLWAASFESIDAELLGAIDRIAVQAGESLVDELLEPQRALLVRHRTSVPEALDLYLRAHALRQASTVVEVKSAIPLLERAFELDPRFALAQFEIGYIYTTLEVFGAVSTVEASVAAQRAVEAALAADPDSAEAHVGLGYIREFFQDDRDAAQISVARALALEPNSGIVNEVAAKVVFFSDPVAAARLAERYRQLRPEDPYAWLIVSIMHQHARDPARALAEAQLGSERFPDDGMLALGRAAAQIELGRCDEALLSLERASPDSLAAGPGLGFLGEAQACVGRKAEARRIAERVESAALWVRLDEPQRAIAAFARGLAAKSLGVKQAHRDLIYDGLRDDPRWIALEHKYRLQPVPRTEWQLTTTPAKVD